MKEMNGRQSFKENHDILVACVSEVCQTIAMYMHYSWNSEVEALKGELVAIRRQQSDLHDSLTFNAAW